MSDIGSFLGRLLVLVLCTWSACFLTKTLYFMIKSRTATDRTLGLVNEEDHPKLFWLEVIGLVVAIAASVMIAASMVFGLLRNRP